MREFDNLVAQLDKNLESRMNSFENDMETAASTEHMGNRSKNNRMTLGGGSQRVGGQMAPIIPQNVAGFAQTMNSFSRESRAMPYEHNSNDRLGKRYIAESQKIVQLTP